MRLREEGTHRIADTLAEDVLVNLKNLLRFVTHRFTDSVDLPACNIPFHSSNHHLCFGRVGKTFSSYKALVKIDTSIFTGVQVLKN